VLCGDCVRFCSEIQDIGAIDFAYRGHDAAVLAGVRQIAGRRRVRQLRPVRRRLPDRRAHAAFGNRGAVWKALNDPAKIVVAQIAPAVRVAIGELFGMPPGESTRGQMVAALKRLGFDRVFRHVVQRRFDGDRGGE
jgi:NADH-quinone oxidoreductase subunit G